MTLTLIQPECKTPLQDINQPSCLQGGTFFAYKIPNVRPTISRIDRDQLCIVQLNGEHSNWFLTLLQSTYMRWPFLSSPKRLFLVDH